MNQYIRPLETRVKQALMMDDKYKLCAKKASSVVGRVISTSKLSIFYLLLINRTVAHITR